MKTRSLIIILAVFIGFGVSAQDKEKTKTIEIKTSAVCGQCKERIEHNLSFEKGVKKVELDLDTKVTTITYKVGKTDKETLKKAITKIGYDADDLEADKKAYEKLPACCKKDAPSH